jgi:hypothetical protein
MNRRVMTSKLYRALFEISALRKEVRALAGEIPEAAESRYLSQLDLLEAAAARLADGCDRRDRSASH